MYPVGVQKCRDVHNKRTEIRKCVEHKAVTSVLTVKVMKFTFSVTSVTNSQVPISFLGFPWLHGDQKLFFFLKNIFLGVRAGGIAH